MSRPETGKAILRRIRRAEPAIGEPLSSVRWDDVLSAEKARRRLRPDDLVFVGASNVTSTLWCPMQAVLRSRDEELMFFECYLRDRLEYSRRLDPSHVGPHGVRDILTTGSRLRLEDIETVLQQQEAPRPVSPRVAGSADDPLARGRIAEMQHAERHPTIRWHFSWNRYVIVCEPDGIARQFVYEFKHTGKRRNVPERKRAALAQAGLYARCFGRPHVRVQVHVEEDNSIQTFDQADQPALALGVLQTLETVDRGSLPAPPTSWKCSRCPEQYRTACRIRTDLPSIKG